MDAEFISKYEYQQIKNFSNEMITEWAKRIIESYWGDKSLKLSIPVYFSNKFWNTGGMFVFSGEQALRIVISKNLIRANPFNSRLVEGILKHELCHYAVYSLHSPKESDDGHPIFENELKRIDAPSTRTVSFNFDRRISLYVCSKCGKYQGNDMERNKFYPLSDCCKVPLMNDCSFLMPSEKTAFERRIFTLTNEFENRKV